MIRVCRWRGAIYLRPAKLETIRGRASWCGAIQTGELLTKSFRAAIFTKIDGVGFGAVRARKNGDDEGLRQSPMARSRQSEYGARLRRGNGTVPTGVCKLLRRWRPAVLRCSHDLVPMQYD